MQILEYLMTWSGQVLHPQNLYTQVFGSILRNASLKERKALALEGKKQRV